MSSHHKLTITYYGITYAKVFTMSACYFVKFPNARDCFNYLGKK